MTEGPRRVTRGRSPAALLAAGLAILGLVLVSILGFVGDSSPSDNRSGSGEANPPQEEPTSSELPEGCGYEGAAGGGGYAGGATRRGCGQDLTRADPASEPRRLR